MRACLVVATLAALLVSGCGGQSKRAAVSGYITRVDDVERGMAGPLAEVTQVNQAFAKSQTKPKAAANLATSERTLRTLQKKLKNITPPPEAKRLHALLLALVGHEVSLAHELAALATFVPRFQSSLQPLAAADNALKKQLGETTKGTAATKALDAKKELELEQYAATIDAVIAELQKLQPPAVWRPGYTAQMSSLEQLRSTALALAQAIRTDAAAAIPTLLQRFDAAAVSDQSVAVQKQQIAAVKAYDARIKTIVSLARKVQLERARLERVYS